MDRGQDLDTYYRLLRCTERCQQKVEQDLELPTPGNSTKADRESSTSPYHCANKDNDGESPVPSAHSATH